MARKQIARVLSASWDVEISFAADGVEALQAMRGGRADVLILDLNMPVMDGYETLRAISEAGLPSRVIVVSGDIQPDARARARRLGALGFAKKPVDPEELSELLEMCGIVRGGAAAHDDPAVKVDLRDCYREIANIAMGQAADLLARLLDVFVVLPIPNVNMLAPSELHMALALTEQSKTVSAVCQGFIGAGIAGEALLLFHDSSFADIARVMKYEGQIDEATERELLMDTASILIGACITGIAAQLDVTFSQGHPVVLGQHVDVSDLLSANMKRGKQTLAIEISYTIENFNISFDLMLLFTEDSIGTLNDKLTFMLD